MQKGSEEGSEGRSEGSELKSRSEVKEVRK
jgi:hypothetical protein